MAGTAENRNQAERRLETAKIADELGRHVSTIYREKKRMTRWQINVKIKTGGTKSVIEVLDKLEKKRLTVYHCHLYCSSERRSDNFVKEGDIKQTFELFIGKTAAQGGLSFQKVKSPVAEDVEVFSGVIRPRPALVLPELHIQNPLQFVPNLPMPNELHFASSI